MRASRLHGENADSIALTVDVLRYKLLDIHDCGCSLVSHEYEEMHLLRCHSRQVGMHVSTFDGSIEDTAALGSSFGISDSVDCVRWTLDCTVSQQPFEQSASRCESSTGL